MRRWLVVFTQLMVVIWVVTFASACAHAPAVTTAAAPVSTTAPSDPKAPSGSKDAEESAPHGSRGAAEPIALPFHLVDGKSGAPVDDAAFGKRLGAARVVYVAEEHPNPHHHAAQLAVLERAYAIDPSVGLGLEMLPRTLQPALDAFVAGTTDEAAFLAAVDWQKTWGFPFGFYRPLLAFCRAHKLHAYALNAPRAITHTIAFDGQEALTAEQKQQLPKLEPGPSAHRELVREAFGGHPHGKFSDAKFERFYLAQLVWDETMADRAAAALAQPGAPRRLVVVAGEGHVRRFAIPDRAARRGAKPYLTIVPLFASDADDAQKDNVADLLWVLETPGATP